MQRSLHSFFCDDVRQEIGQKLSLMGLYQTTLLVPSFPYELPRLFVVMKATADEHVAFKSLTFSVMFNDEVLDSIPVDEAVFKQQPPPSLEIPNVNDLRTSQSLMTIIGLRPLKIEGPSIIRTRAFTEDETLYGDGLLITQRPSE